MKDAGWVPPTVEDDGVDDNIINTERALLGALINDPSLLQALETFPIKGENFSLEHHSDIFDALVRFGPSEKAAFHRLANECGGLVPDDLFMKCLHQALLAATVPDESYIRSLTRIVFNKYLAREGIAIAERLKGRIRAGGDVRMAISLSLAETDSILNASRMNRGWVRADEALERVYEASEFARNNGFMRGVPTGLRGVDDALGGLRKGEYYALHARPAMGKSALALKIARNIAQQCLYEADGTDREPLPVLIYSLEMDAETNTTRLLAQISRMNAKDIATGKVDFNKMVAHGKQVHRLPLYFLDGRKQSVATMRSAARAMAQRFGGIKAIIVDHIHITKTDNAKLEALDNQKYAQIVADAREMAQELDCPVLGLGQLNRDCEKREDKRPQMSDLRASGGIEENADVVMFIYRDEYYAEKEKPQGERFEGGENFQKKMDQWNKRMLAAQGWAELIFAKVRGGAGGQTVRLRFDGPTTDFIDPDEWDQRPSQEVYQ